MTPIQELDEYLFNTAGFKEELGNKNIDENYLKQTIEFVQSLREKERLIINKAHADGVMWGLQAVTGNKVSETNYYEEKYGTSRDSK